VTHPDPLTTDTLELVAHFWDETEIYTRDFPDTPLRMEPFVAYLNRLHIKDIQLKVTKAKISYLQEAQQGEAILQPRVLHQGKKRTTWGYSVNDARCVLVAELLKERAQLTVQEIKGWLRLYLLARTSSEITTVPASVYSTHERTKTPPELQTLAYTLLRSRVLSSLLIALGKTPTVVMPKNFVIALLVTAPVSKVDYAPARQFDYIQTMLGRGNWFLAASYPPQKAYLYKSLSELQTKRGEHDDYDRFEWYHIGVQDPYYAGAYELVVGIGPAELDHPQIEPILHTLRTVTDSETPLSLGGFRGLATLMRTAFLPEVQIPYTSGSSIKVMAEIIQEMSDLWDYCAIMVPSPSPVGTITALRIVDSSSKFPVYLRSAQVSVGEYLSGWAYAYRQSVVVNPTVPDDPRIAAYRDETPDAAIAVPAVASIDRDAVVMGVVYVGRKKQPLPLPVPFPDEIVAALELMGLVCGDVLGREQIEIETDLRMAARCKPATTDYETFEHLAELGQRVASLFESESPEAERPAERVHLLTIQLHTPSNLDPRLHQVIRWHYELVVELARNVLRQQFEKVEHPEPLMGQWRGKDQIVIALLERSRYPEDHYHQDLTRLLNDRLEHMQLKEVDAKIYVWGVSFAGSRLPHDFNGEPLGDFFGHRIRRALKAAPYLSDGHMALHENRLAKAEVQFKAAIEVDAEMASSHKHLAEAYSLQGKYTNAIASCKAALEHDPRYASAHSLMGDNYMLNGDYEQALGAYLAAIDVNPQRSDFRVRYALALGIWEGRHAQSRDNVERLQLHLHDVQQLNEMLSPEMGGRHPRSHKEGQHQQAQYHFLRGFTSLYADKREQAQDEFQLARSLAPYDLQIFMMMVYITAMNHSCVP
jgi:tetratricopeptide (TPR) repeat protein